VTAGTLPTPISTTGRISNASPETTAARFAFTGSMSRRPSSSGSSQIRNAARDAAISLKGYLPWT
jgi:hypothetical protein